MFCGSIPDSCRHESNQGFRKGEKESIRGVTKQEWGAPGPRSAGVPSAPPERVRMCCAATPVSAPAGARSASQPVSHTTPLSPAPQEPVLMPDTFLALPACTACARIMISFVWIPEGVVPSCKDTIVALITSAVYPPVTPTLFSCDKGWMG